MIIGEWESDIHKESYDRSNAAVQCIRSLFHTCTCTCTMHKREDFGKFLIDRQVECIVLGGSPDGL